MLHGAPLYEFLSALHLPFTYPPFAAIAFAPLALGPPGLAMAWWTLVSVLAMAATIWLLLGTAGVHDPGSRLRWTALASVAALVMVDLARRSGRLHGVAIGIAAGIKLTPLIFIPYLLLTRRWRAARTAALTFAATVLIGLLLLPGDAVRYWSGSVLGSLRVATSDDARILNSSILGTIERLHLPHTGAIWFVLAVIVGSAGLVLSAWASRRGHEYAGILGCGVTGVLISPVSWLFHWVWCVPLLLLWAVRAWRDNRAGEKAGVVVAWLAFSSSFSWVALQLFLLPVPAGMTVLYANMYVPVGIGVLIGLAGLLWLESRPARVPVSRAAGPRGGAGTPRAGRSVS